MERAREESTDFAAREAADGDDHFDCALSKGRLMEERSEVNGRKNCIENGRPKAVRRNCGAELEFGGVERGKNVGHGISRPQFILML